MSRIGKRVLTIPENVNVNVDEKGKEITYSRYRRGA